MIKTSRLTQYNLPSPNHPKDAAPGDSRLQHQKKVLIDRLLSSVDQKNTGTKVFDENEFASQAEGNAQLTDVEHKKMQISNLQAKIGALKQKLRISHDERSEVLAELRTEQDRNNNLLVLERMKSVLDLNAYRH